MKIPNISKNFDDKLDGLKNRDEISHDLVIDFSENLVNMFSANQLEDDGIVIKRIPCTKDFWVTEQYLKRQVFIEIEDTNLSYKMNFEKRILITLQVERYQVKFLDFKIILEEEKVAWNPTLEALPNVSKESEDNKNKGIDFTEDAVFNQLEVESWCLDCLPELDEEEFWRSTDHWAPKQKRKQLKLKKKYWKSRHDFAKKRKWTSDWIDNKLKGNYKKVVEKNMVM